MEKSQVLIAQDSYEIKDDQLDPSKNFIHPPEVTLGSAYNQCDLYADTSGTSSLVSERPKMIINPNTEERDEMLKQIDLLDGSCPTRVMDFKDDTECPCDMFIHQGKCEYGLFVRKED